MGEDGKREERRRRGKERRREERRRRGKERRKRGEQKDGEKESKFRLLRNGNETHSLPVCLHLGSDWGHHWLDEWTREGPPPAAVPW